ncbi:MAG: 30S ribosomal protein S10 [Desulfurococcales archaeon]|nr:30S ribosomal protein S10 [Desulfurococcales archaeon]
MVRKVRIWLWSPNHKSLEKVVEQIVQIAEKTGAPIRGPIPLPTKRLVVPVFRLPHGEGSKHWERWEMRIHKRLIDVAADERVMKQIMRVRVPKDVHIEVKII